MKTCAGEGSIGVGLGVVVGEGGVGLGGRGVGGRGSAGVEEAERGDNGNVGLNFSTAATFWLKNMKGQTLLRFPGVFGEQT